MPDDELPLELWLARLRNRTWLIRGQRSREAIPLARQHDADTLCASLVRHRLCADMLPQVVELAGRRGGNEPYDVVGVRRVRYEQAWHVQLGRENRPRGFVRELADKIYNTYIVGD
jgi:hypothetical protein